MFAWIRKPPRGANSGSGAPATDPPEADAAQLKRQGNALLAEGRIAEATDCYRRASTLDPLDADARVNLGFALCEQELYARAEEPLRQAVALAPGSVDAHYMLAVTLREQGRVDLAVEHYRRALALQPSFASCRRDLVRALLDSNRTQEARDRVAEGLALDADDAELHHYLGNLQTTAKEYDAAVASFERALALQPRNAGALTNLGFALHKQGKLDAALTRQQQALAIYPDLAEAHFNLGAVLQARGRLAEAEQSFRQALALKPGYVDPHVNLGALLQSQGRLDDATESLRAALVLAPQHADARNNLATVLLDQGRTDTAIEHLLTALRANAASPEVHCNLGAALQRLGSVDAAIEHYRAAIELDPGLLDAHSNLLFMLSFHAECSPAEYLAEARRYGAKLAARVRALPNRPEAAAADPMRPLRVGMVSGDLKAHPVGYFVESLLNSLDRRRVELIAYPTQPREDDLTARLKPLFAAWSPIFGSSDEEAARRIHADGIDILIDLAGHSAHNRLPVFAWRPAPVQLTWLGYFASTGVPGIDTLIADPVSVPERHRAHFSETICYLPDTRLCFTPPRAAATLAVAPLPALTNGHLTFGCFQASSKINEHVLAAWGRIFQALSGARLRLQNQEMGTPSARSTMLARLGAVGLAAERVTLVGATPRDEYLAAHGEVDIILDTFPYPGGTTTCEALWMGVPTLTLVGETMLSRQGAALMACVGLTEWVAGDEEDYVDRALGHAADLNRLAGLRQGLRQQVLASPLFDAPRFASRLESLLQGLWAKRTTELRGDN